MIQIGTTETAKAVIYTRVASGTAYSIQQKLDEQESRCRSYANSEGLEIISVYSDRGAARDGNASLLRFLEDSEDVKILIIDDVARLSRQYNELFEILGRVRSAGCTVHSAASELRLGGLSYDL